MLQRKNMHSSAPSLLLTTDSVRLPTHQELDSLQEGDTGHSQHRRNENGQEMSQVGFLHTVSALTVEAFSPRFKGNQNLSSQTWNTKLLSTT